MGRIHVVQEEIFEDIMIDYNENNGELDGIPFGLHSVVHENKSLGIEKGVIYV